MGRHGPPQYIPGSSTASIQVSLQPTPQARPTLAICPTLQQLEDEGLIESERLEGRRVYRLTAAGKAELDKDPEAVNRIWRRAERWEDWGQWMGPEAFAVFRPLAGMVKATFRTAKWAHGRPEREEKLAAIIERFRNELDEFRGDGS